MILLFNWDERQNDMPANMVTHLIQKNFLYYIFYMQLLPVFIFLSHITSQLQIPTTHSLHPRHPSNPFRKEQASQGLQPNSIKDYNNTRLIPSHEGWISNPVGADTTETRLSSPWSHCLEFHKNCKLLSLNIHADDLGHISKSSLNPAWVPVNFFYGSCPPGDFEPSGSSDPSYPFLSSA